MIALALFSDTIRWIEPATRSFPQLYTLAPVCWPKDSACANEQNRFWDYHDIAFETKGKISQADLMDIASTQNLDLEAFKSCLDSDRGLRVVQEDINAAIHAGVRSTPTLFINGRGLSGVPKPWMLNEILNFQQEGVLAPPK